MSMIPRLQQIIGFDDVFRKSPPTDRLSLVAGICKKNLITELAGLNYRLKPKDSKYYDTSFDRQMTELKYFCGQDYNLFKKYGQTIFGNIPNEKDYPLVFTRQTCIYALEEIIQSGLPVIKDFRMGEVKIWESIFKYILAINTTITKIQESKNGDPINFETLNPKMLPLNERSLNSDPIYIPFRGYKLLQYLHNHREIGEFIKDYFEQTYSMQYDNFVYEIMGMYLSKRNQNANFDFHYSVEGSSTLLFDILSDIYKSDDVSKLLSIRKSPFYKSTKSSYILTDNILLLDKLYNQLINDFWFDCLKHQKKEDGKSAFNIKEYKSIIGYFFEKYIREIINYSFCKAQYYSILQFEELKTNFGGNQIEIADLYIRYNSKVILGQVKSTTIYDNEKYAGNIDKFYKNDRNKFFESFGVDQLVNSIKILNDTVPKVDKKFPTNKSLKIFPVIIFNEKALQTPLMGKIFQDRFSELMKDFNNRKIFIYPLSLIHVSDLENLQDFLFNNHKEVWNILKFHCKGADFMPPFYNSLNRKNVKPNYKRTEDLFEELIQKYNTIENGR